MSIFIARHGETDDNAERRIQMPSSPLSIIGNQQAELLAKRLASSGVTRIIASDYKRTQETASYTADLVGVDVELNSLFRERHFGDLRGQLYSDLSEDPFDLHYSPPNGESWGEFHERVASAWRAVTDVANQTEGNVLIITHGFVCRSLVEKQLTIPSDISSASLIGNTALTEVEHNEPWAVKVLNCTAHLSDVEGLADEAPV